MSYGSRNLSGEWTGTVTLSDQNFRNQSISAASSATGLNKGLDGILGVGPVNLTSDTVSNTSTVLTVFGSLFAQGTISEEVLGVYFVPDPRPSIGGELTFGGYGDSKVIKGNVKYVPLTMTPPASRYWGIDQSVSYGVRT